MAGTSTLLQLLSGRRLGIRARFTLLFYLVSLLSLGVVGFYGYINSVEAHLRMAEEHVKDHVARVSQEITDFLDLTRSDLGYFATNNDFLRHLYWWDLGDDHKHDQWHAVTLDAWRDFVRSYDYLFKVRFLDLEGRERMVIRRDPRTREVRALDDSELQDITGEPYFSSARDLGPGRSIVTSLDLNREHGRIERPLVPVVRLAQPVLGENKVRYGVVVLDLFADAFFDYIHEANRQIDGGALYLVDGNGDFLFHPDPAKSFAHLLGHGENFHALFPGGMEALTDREEGTLLHSGHVLGFKRIFPQPGDREHYWILVGAVEEAEVLGDLTTFKYLFFTILAGSLLLVFLASRFYLDNLMRPLAAVTRQVERLGRGEILREPVAYTAADEIGRMLTSTERLTANLEALAVQADSIAAGDFSRSVPVLSGTDRLGEAINNMTRMLRDNREESERRNWLQEGIGRLNQRLSGELEPAELGDRAVEYVGRYLEAGHGVFYLFDEREQVLELLGSYMFTERDRLNQRLQPGQGAVGQVARERKPILLREIRPGEQEVATGTVSVTPVGTYTVPLLYEGRLYGVLELAALRPFREVERQFMDEAAGVIGAFLFSVLQRRRIRELLDTAEVAKRQAEERSGQLQEVNTRMESQQQQLQQQTEELQQTNAQMEEQQQQLQQQTEELQQTNAQMEEQQQQLEQQTRDMALKNQELEASKKELDRRAQELEQASRYKSEFLANMSHELRTPLNSIILLSRMLTMNEEGNLSEEQTKRAAVIHHAGEELLRLINDILDLSKIEAGKMELHLQRVQSGELAAEYHDLFQATAQEKGLEFRVEDELEGELTTDRDKLSQIVRNLLSNAFKFTREGSITLRVEPSGKARLPVRIAVIDTGIGIPEEKRRLIFEAFQQVDGSISREYGGTGLGLSISLRFAQLLGGTIELESTPGEGSVFAVLLPRALQGGEKPAAGMTPRPAATGGTATAAVEMHDDRGNLRSGDRVILLIDDDPVFCDTLATLNRRLGYKTLVALNAEEGLRMARAYRPSGILLDLGLPDRDGTEVLGELKATRELRDIPVYVVSARDRDEGLLRQGIVGFLQKPVDEGRLADAEARVLARAAGEVGRVLVIEDGSLGAESVRRMLGVEPVRLRACGSVEEALEELQSAPCDLAIVDLGREGVERGLAIAARLTEGHPDLALMFYGEQSLDDDAEARLREYSDSIILKAPHSEERMLENIERFLREVPQAAVRHRQAVSGGSEGSKRLKGRRVLVVDDDPRNLFVITSALEQQGAMVENALNGRKALEFLNKQSVDLVFTDIMMPEMDGYETIAAIKANPALAHIPVVALTAKALKADRAKAMAAGADDYLAKPVDYEVLVNMAGVWCDKS